jgi:hypothetical protein
MDSALSPLQPDTPVRSCRAPEAHPPQDAAGPTHGCCINFNADGTIWACVPTSMILTSCSVSQASVEIAEAVLEEAKGCCMPTDANCWLASSATIQLPDASVSTEITLANMTGTLNRTAMVALIWMVFCG